MYNFNVQISIMHKLFVIKCREALINLPLDACLHILGSFFKNKITEN